MRYQEFLPHEALQDFVKRFWILERGYTPDDPTDEIPPDACVELIFNFGSPYFLVEDGTERPLPSTYLVGMQDRTLTVGSRGVVKIVAARFFAWGLLPFLDLHATPGSTAAFTLDAEWHALAERMRADVQHDHYEDAAERLEGFFLGKRLKLLEEPRKVQAAAKLLYQTKGQARIHEVADACGLSVRQLQRQFDQQTRVAPKTLARTIRFEAVRERLMHEPDANLTDLAYELGYADQAHFIKDFKALTGKTPGEFAASMRAFQAVLRDRENVVFLQSPPSMPDYPQDVDSR